MQMTIELSSEKNDYGILITILSTLIFDNNRRPLFYEKETDLSQFSAQQNQTALLLQNDLKDLLLHSM